MKKYCLPLFIILLFTGFTFSQSATPSFTLTKDGVKPVIMSFDPSYDSKLIYNRVKEWILLTYKSPKSVIRSDVENSLVKIGSYKEKAWKVRSSDIDYWYVMNYTLTIEIKESRCRVTFASDELKYKSWFNKDGTLIKKFKDSKTTIETSMNELLVPLYNQIKGVKKKPTNDW